MSDERRERPFDPDFGQSEEPDGDFARFYGGGSEISEQEWLAILARGSETADDKNMAIPPRLPGEGSLIKEGSGTLILSGTNHYSGGTELCAGTLDVSHDACMAIDLAGFAVDRSSEARDPFAEAKTREGEEGCC